MRQKSMTTKDTAEQAVRDIRRKTRKQYSAEEKIRIVLEGLRGEESIAALCRREGIAESLYYSWSKEFLEAGKKRLAGDTARQATSNEVKTLRAETRNLNDPPPLSWSTAYDRKRRTTDGNQTTQTGRYCFEAAAS